MGKSLRPPEIILGLPYSSKVFLLMLLGCTVGYVLFALHCRLIPYFFREISFVEWKATRPRGEGRRRWGHARLAYFHIWGSYSAESRPQVEIKRGIY